MLRRLLFGLILGLIVGGLVAAAIVGGLHVVDFDQVAAGGLVAYLLAAGTGVLTGLVAGKPIWASGAKIEAGLKALFGALAGVGLMFAMRRWLGAPVHLGSLGAAPVGDLPAVSLPLLAAALGAIFELDNTGEDERRAATAPGSDGKKRVAVTKTAAGSHGKAKSRIEAYGDGDIEEASDAPAKRAKR